MAMERKVVDAEDSFAEAMRSLEEHNASLRMKDAQLREVMEKLQSLKGKSAFEAREIQLLSAKLCQRLDTQEEEGERLIARVEAINKGIGLDFEALIQTPAFDEIRLYLLQSCSDQTIEKVKAKMPDLDLSFLDDDDASMVDAKVVQKGVQETSQLGLVIIKGGTERDPELGSEVPASVEGGQPVDPVDQNLVN